MLKQNLIIELRDKNSIFLELKSSYFKKKVLYCTEISKEFIEIKNKSLYIIIEGEEVYIKTLLIPNCSNDAVKRIICQELNISLNNAENLTYSYKILSKTKNVLEILAFYLNSEKLAKLKVYNLNNNNKLKLINVIQFYIFNYYYKDIKEKVYLLAFAYNNNLYILGCNNNSVILNSLIKNYNSLDNVEKIISLIHKNFRSINDNIIEKVYLVNLSGSKLLQELSEHYEVCDLGILSKEQLCKSILGNERYKWKN